MHIPSRNDAGHHLDETVGAAESSPQLNSAKCLITIYDSDGACLSHPAEANKRTVR